MSETTTVTFQMDLEDAWVVAEALFNQGERFRLAVPADEGRAERLMRLWGNLVAGTARCPEGTHRRVRGVCCRCGRDLPLDTTQWLALDLDAHPPKKRWRKKSK